MNFIFSEPNFSQRGKVILSVEVDKKHSFCISLDYQCFYNTRLQYVSKEILDLLVIATAIYAVDRFIPQKLDNATPIIQIVLPLLMKKNHESFSSKLSDLLFWLTNFHWEFNFTSSKKIKKELLLQGNLSFLQEPTTVMLWSGGLDALAALYTSFTQKSNQSFTLVGTGGNSASLKYQKELFEELPLNLRKNCTFLQIPINILKKPKSLSENKLTRSRGAVFMLVGSACSLMMNTLELNICENGIGAMNLPYSSSSLSLDNSRSIHPYTLYLVQNFISAHIEKEFKIYNPFLFWTKSKMCESLIEDNQLELIYRSVSCDSPHRKQGGRQCGYCTSCLLRRLSIESCGIKDRTEYLVKKNKESIREDIKIPIKAMLAQAFIIKKIIDAHDVDELRWEHLSNNFYDLQGVLNFLLINSSATKKVLIKNFVNIYGRHSMELIQISSKSFLEILDSSEIEQIRLYALTL